MAIKKHVFITESGTLLPRWVEAFPNAVGVNPVQLTRPIAAEVIWLRLQPSLSVSEQLQTLTGKASVIVLSDRPDDDEALTVFSLSARGYANSHAATETLKQIARVVDQGGLWIGEALMQRVVAGLQNLPNAPRAASSATYSLTERELEVAQAIAAGASNKDVARQMNITERTVKAHVSHLFVKMGVQDRLQLALKMRELPH